MLELLANNPILFLCIVIVLLFVLWLIIESAVTMGVKNGLVKAEKELNSYGLTLVKEIPKKPYKNKSNKECDANLR